MKNNRLNLSETLKKFSIQNIEKVILTILVFALIGTVLKLSLSLVQKMASQESFIYSSDVEKKVQPPTGLSSEEYTELVKTIQHPLPADLTRDLFVQKSEEQSVIEPKTSEREDSDQDGMPNDWEVQFGLDPKDPADAKKDLDQDGYSNLDEYMGGADPKDPNSFPGALKLQVLNIYRKGIRVNFFGYIKLPDGSFQIQINWEKRTSFPRVGQKIRGFKIIDFFQKTEKKFNPQINAEETVDISHIQIQKGNEPPITLVIGKPSFEKELHATILDQVTRKTYTVHYGSKFKGYKVLDITPTKVTISRDKKIYTVSFLEKGNS